MVPSCGKYIKYVSEAPQGAVKKRVTLYAPFHLTQSHVVVAQDAGERPLGGFCQELEPKDKRPWSMS